MNTKESPRKKKGVILIVDDTPENLRLLSNMLRDQGYIVRSVTDGKMAFKSIGLDAPDLILLDINMPEMNGYEVCQQLKRESSTTHIPVIFVSALDEVVDKVRAFTVGGVDYISKPFQIEEVLVRIENQLTIQRTKNELREANDELSHLVQELEQRNHEMHLLNQMSDFLQRAQTIQEAISVTLPILQQLFAEQKGALYLLNHDTLVFELTVTIGEEPTFPPTITGDMCWALQGARVFLCEDSEESVQCQHTDVEHTEYPYLCIQLVTRGETLGLFHLQKGPPDLGDGYERWERKAAMVADRLALSFSNITLREQLHEQSIRDPLTNLFNRRYLNEIFKRELNRSQRENLSIGVILIDIDHFKQYNDTYGHEGGDVLLRNLGVFLQEHIRAEDVACRFGGEEFILVLPGSSLQITHERAWTLCRQVRYITAEHDNRQLGHITLSAGVACFPNHGKTVEQLIMVVDDALYRAKRLGRDRVCVAGQE